MFAVYVRIKSWGAWGEAERWFLHSRHESRSDAERIARAHKALVVFEEVDKRPAPQQCVFRVTA
jgi:hypothetical protein